MSSIIHTGYVLTWKSSPPPPTWPHNSPLSSGIVDGSNTDRLQDLVIHGHLLHLLPTRRSRPAPHMRTHSIASTARVHMNSRNLGWMMKRKSQPSRSDRQSLAIFCFMTALMCSRNSFSSGLSLQRWQALLESQTWCSFLYLGETANRWRHPLSPDKLYVFLLRQVSMQQLHLSQKPLLCDMSKTLEEQNHTG